MDNLTKRQRKKCMSRIRSRDTKLEIKFRKALWKLGYRGYRITQDDFCVFINKNRT